MTRTEARARRSQDNGGARRPVLRSSSFGDTALAAGHVGPSFIAVRCSTSARLEHTSGTTRMESHWRASLSILYSNFHQRFFVNNR